MAAWLSCVKSIVYVAVQAVYSIRRALTVDRRTICRSPAVTRRVGFHKLSSSPYVDAVVVGVASSLVTTSETTAAAAAAV